MKRIGATLVGAVIRLYPASFRQRFGDEMLSAYLDQRDALPSGNEAPALVRARHTARTVAGLTRALVEVRLEERQRLRSLRQHHRPHRNDRMRNFASDTRHALRVLRTNPGFAAVTILTLALGIGANTAVFSVLNSVILAPLPYDAPEQLVRIYTAGPRIGEKVFSSGLDVLDVRHDVDAFSSVAIFDNYRDTGGDLEKRDGSSQRIRLLPVNAEYFRTLRATPLMGRTFSRDEERGSVRRIILSHQLWTGFAGRDPGVVGRTIVLDGEAYEVIGIMRPNFTDVVTGDVAAWIPQDLLPSGGNNRRNLYLSAVARLRPGVSVAQAQAKLNALMSRLGAQFPDSHKDRRLRLVPLREDIVAESESTIYVLMGAAALVLLIACLNVANLFLARSVAQTRETAIRAALGARRSRLIGQRLMDSLVVALAGGTVGSVVAYWGVKVLLAVSPESLARAEEVRFDPRLLGFAIVVTVVTGMLFGAGPAVGASRSDPSDAMREGSRGNTGGRGGRNARSVLVASQISLALVLLVGAGVLIRSFIARQRVNLGFNADRLATFELNLPAARYDSAARRIQFHAAYRERLRSLPGVLRVGATSWLPANGNFHQWGFDYTDDAGQDRGVPAQIRVIDGDFLEALGIPVRRGRTFTVNDRLDTEDVALISGSLAARVYGARDPIGQKFRTGGREFTVIGVVGDVASESRGTTFATVYLSHAQFADDRNWTLTYVVKTNLPLEQIVEPARRELARIDPALVLYQPRAMDTVLARHRARERFTLLLMATFAGVALSLAAVGVYGVLSYVVTQRTHEIGVRIALGARPAQVRAIVMRQGLIVAGIGMLVGLAGAFALSRLLRTLAFGVSTRDPVVFMGVTLVLGVVVVAAGYIPTRRATRVDPLDALRAE